MTAPQPMDAAERAALSNAMRHVRDIADCATLYDRNTLLALCTGTARLLATIDALEAERSAMPDCLVIDFTLRLGRSESPCLCCGTNHVFGLGEERDGSSVDLRAEIEQWLYERRFDLEHKRVRLTVEVVQGEARDA